MPRQRSQQGTFLGQADGSARILLPEHLPQERRVAVATEEVPAAPQHQRLVYRRLEAMVPLLDVAILVALARLHGLGRQLVVLQQGLIASLERLRPVHPRLHRGRQPVGAMQLRHAAQFPQRILQAFAEALVALGKADGAGLPVGVGQHEVVEQVGERTAVDRYAQVRAVGEVAGRQTAGMMLLGEEDLLRGAVLGPPPLEPPLQRP